MSVENRKSIRAERSFDIRHRLSKQAFKRTIEPWLMSKTKDISSSGASFVSPVSYQRDDVLEIEITTAGVIEVYKGFAKVVRVQEQWGSFHIAVMFITQDETKKKKRRNAKTHL